MISIVDKYMMRSFTEDSHLSNARSSVFSCGIVPTYTYVDHDVSEKVTMSQAS